MPGKFEPRVIMGPFGPLFEMAPNQFVAVAHVIGVDLTMGKGQILTTDGTTWELSKETTDALVEYFNKPASNVSDLTVARGLPGLRS